MTANGRSLSCVDRERGQRRGERRARRAPRPGSRARPTTDGTPPSSAATTRNTVADIDRAHAGPRRRARRYTSPALIGVATVAWYVPHPLHAAQHRPQRLARRLHHGARGQQPGRDELEVVDARRRRPMPLSTRSPSPRPIAARNSSGVRTSREHRRRATAGATRTHSLLDDPHDAAAWPRQSSSVRPVRIRNTSSSVPRRTSTDSGCTPSSATQLDDLRRRRRCRRARGRRAPRPARRRSARRGSAASRASAVGEAQLDDLTRRVLRDQLARRALGDDAAAVHDHEPVAELLGLVHVVRREHEGHALALQPVEALPQEVARLRVEAGGGLVEQQQLGLVDERARDREPALHAARQRVDEVVAPVGELHELEQLLGPLADLRPRQVEVAPVDEEVVETVSSVSRLSSCGTTPSRARISGPSTRGSRPSTRSSPLGRPATRSRSCASSTSCPRRSGRGSRTPRPARRRSRCRRPRRSCRSAW